ncbi:MAG: efflux RND transporter periplasmic adaptor subunit [Burkholderiales bacterium]|nr:efflux RND transporter periplasmic adaptor subunit [Burkholderiales bacterium]
MKLAPRTRRTVALMALLAPMLALFVYVALRSGPLAPTAVTVVRVERGEIVPELYGLGTVQARRTYKIGPTYAGRVKRLDVHVGDRVRAGQVLGEMDAVDLDSRLLAQQAAIQGAEAAARQAQARQSFAQAQAARYERLGAVHAVSDEGLASKRQELAVADASVAASQEDIRRMRAERGALRAQRGNLRLVAPVDGLVASRDAEPGTTVVAGQSVIELIDPASVWVDARFDQISADGLVAGRPAVITLRSQQAKPLAGHVLRLGPRADAVTEETLAKVTFDAPPTPLPPLGELVEVRVAIAPLAPAPIIPNAAIRTVDGRRGVWRLTDGKLAFVPVRFGRADLGGRVQVHEGLAVGDTVVLYSDATLSANRRIVVREQLAGVTH